MTVNLCCKTVEQDFKDTFKATYEQIQEYSEN